MTKTLDEKVAEKMGWEQGIIQIPKHIPGLYSEIFVWIAPDETKYDHLPSFSTDWNATKILIKFMRERDWLYDIGDFDGAFSFWWFDQINGYGHVNKEIYSDNLPLAACEAFLLIDLEAKSE